MQALFTKQTKKNKSTKKDSVTLIIGSKALFLIMSRPPKVRPGKSKLRGFFVWQNIVSNLS